MTPNVPSDTTALARESAAKFRERFHDLRAYRDRRETIAGHAPEQLRAMVEAGWFGTLIPEQHGGVGLGFAEMGAILEELGRGLLAEPLTSSAVLAVRLLTGCEPGIRDDLLPAFTAGNLLVATAWQEHATDYDPTAVATSAKPVEAGYLLAGTKRFVAGADLADAFIVSAQAPDGLGLFWLPRERVEDSLSYAWRADGSSSGTLVLDDVQVDAEGRLAGHDKAPALLRRALDEANVMIAAELTGIMARALEITLDYMRTRVQFDRLIGSFQALQHRAVDLNLQRELATSVLAEAVAALDGELADDARSLIASRAKARCAEAATRIGRDAVQLHGAIGFTDECDVGLYLKRAMTLASWLGGPGWHRSRIVGSKPWLRQGQTGPDGPVSGRPRLVVSASDHAGQNWELLDDGRFRAIAADVFATHLPAHLRFLPRRPLWEEVEGWYRALSRVGWLAPAWPVEHGGMGLGPGKLMIYYEELGRSGAPRHLEQGINYIGPLLIARGTEEQRAAYLPKILTGEHLWCQGYSEPGSGSDLASLRTRAELVDGEFHIYGQKIWTTMAHQATHMYALVRTGTGARKQEGISLLLLPLDQPNIRIRPIRNIAGHTEFCEVFLDGARTPAGNLVGTLNDGWRIAQTLLGFERNTVGSPRQCRLALRRLQAVASALSLDKDPRFVERLAGIWMDVEDLGSMYGRFVQSVRGGATPGLEVSAMKIWATETLQAVTELTIEAAGECGALAGEQRFGDESLDILTPFLDLRSVTISAGSSQVQRNVLAKRVLGLG